MTVQITNTHSHTCSIITARGSCLNHPTSREATNPTGWWTDMAKVKRRPKVRGHTHFFDVVDMSDHLFGLGTGEVAASLIAATRCEGYRTHAHLLFLRTSAPALYISHGAQRVLPLQDHETDFGQRLSPRPFADDASGTLFPGRRIGFSRSARGLPAMSLPKRSGYTSRWDVQ